MKSSGDKRRLIQSVSTIRLIHSYHIQNILEILFKNELKILKFYHSSVESILLPLSTSYFKRSRATISLNLPLVPSNMRRQPTKIIHHRKMKSKLRIVRNVSNKPRSSIPTPRAVNWLSTTACTIQRPMRE